MEPATRGRRVGIRRTQPGGAETNVSNPYEIRRVDPDRTADWGQFVEDHPAATVFHSRAWLVAVESAFGYDPRHVLVYETGGTDPVGAVPGFSIPGIAGRSVLNPFCEYGFPLLAADVDPVPVLQVLSADVGPLGARILKDAEWTDIGGYNPAGYGAVPTGEVIRLDTARPFETVRETSFSAEARRCVRSARVDLTVRPGSISAYHSLYLETMRRLGSPQFPEAFLLDLAAELGDDLLVLLAEREGEVVGGLLALDHGETRVIWGSASRREAWDLHPNHRLYAAAIRDACETDLAVVDFGRSRPGTGVHGFKRQFGGRRSSLVSFVAPPHRAGRASLSGYGRVASVAERLGPLLTHPAIGPRLKRFVHE